MSAIPAFLPVRPKRQQTQSPDHAGRSGARAGRTRSDSLPDHVEVGTTRSQRRARPRLVAAILTVAGLFAILAAQLLLTIATSEGAYEISALQSKENELARDEQKLVEQLQVLEAPQHLAEEAHALGMVPSSSAAYLRLSDSTVLGVATVASASAALRTAEDGSSLIPNALLDEVPLVGATPDAAADSSAEGAPATAAEHAPVASTPVGIPAPITH